MFQRAVRDPLRALGRILGDPIAPLAVISSLGVVGILLQLDAELNHDVGWILVATRKVLRGAEFGTGVVDPNPPLAFYIYAPVIALTRVTGISEANASRLFVLCLTAGSLLLSNVLLRRLLATDERASRGYFLALQAFVLLVWPVARFQFAFGSDYAQREHLMTMCLLPFLLLCSARASRKDVPYGVALVTGATTGLAVSLKPQFLVAIAGLLIFEMARRSADSGSPDRGSERGRDDGTWSRTTLLPEWVALASCGAAYVAFVLLFARGYLTISLPLALDTYWAYQSAIAKLVTTHDTLFLVLSLGAAVMVPRGSVYRNVAWAFCIGEIGFYASYLIGRTDWGYHLLPFRSTALVLLGLPVIARVHTGPPLRGNVRRAVAFAGLFLVILALVSRLPLSIGPKLQHAIRGDFEKASGNEITDAIERHAEGGTVLFLSMSLVGFPAVNYAGVGWASRFSCLWPLSAVIRSRVRPEDVPSHIRTEDLLRIERDVIDAVVDDLDANPPDLIFLVDGWNSSTGAFSFEPLPYLLTRPAFADRWRHYEELSPVGKTRVFRRRESFGSG